MTNHPIFYSEYKYRLKYDMYMYNYVVRYVLSYMKIEM